MFLIGRVSDLLRLITAGFIVLGKGEKAIVTFITFSVLDYIRLYIYEKFHTYIVKEAN